MKDEQLHELLYQALETERGGVQIYEAALRCARDEGLLKEWAKYHQQTIQHVKIVQRLFDVFGLDADRQTPGRTVVNHLGRSLVQAMDMARSKGLKEGAELVAAECVTLAETKDHLNWELLGVAAESLKGEQAEALKAAVEEVEEQEDEHLYHTTGWCRELWIKSLGIDFVLPPPEEQKHVKTAIGAERAKNERQEMARSSSS